LCHWNFSLR